MFEGTKRRNAPFWIPPLDILKLLGLFLCLGLSLFRACSGPVGTPLSIDTPAKQLVAGTRGEVFGKAAPGSTVNVYQGSQYLGDTVARADGTWNYALPALAVGSYAISARSANADVAVPVNVEVVDAKQVPATQAPTAVQAKPLPASAPVILSPVGGAVLPQSQLGNAEGTANAGNKVGVFDGDVKIGETTAGPNGRWTLALPALSIGAHRLIAKAVGGDGAEVASYPTQLNVTAPVAPTAPPPTVEVKAVAPTATAETKAAAVAPTATTAAAAAPAATATAEPAKPTATAEVKSAAPAATATAESIQPTATAEVKGAAPAATATAESVVPTATVAAGAAAPTPAATTAVTETASAVEPPAIASPANGASLPVAKLGEVSGVAAANSKVEVSVDGKPLGAADADKDGKWSLALSGLKPGEHTLGAKDANGVSDETKIMVVAPPVAPVIINIKDGSKVEAGKPVDVAGTGPAGSAITVYQNGNKVGETQSDAKGKWKLTTTQAVDPGKYKITAVASDKTAGDSAQSNTVEIEVGITVLLPTTGEDLSGN